MSWAAMTGRCPTDGLDEKGDEMMRCAAALAPQDAAGIETTVDLEFKALLGANEGSAGPSARTDEIPRFYSIAGSSATFLTACRVEPDPD